jgi:uncharacterized membrane protein
MAAAASVTRSVSTVVLVLIAIGLAATIGRVLFPADLIQRSVSVRAGLLQAWDPVDHLNPQRQAEIARADRPFAEHRVLTLLHVVPGGLFFLFAPLQFSARLRTRYLKLHRYSGRILLPVIIISLIPGLVFGIGLPFGGPAEAWTIAGIGIFLLYSMAMALAAIRRGDVARHREWMIRMFANTLTISTIRLVGGPMDLVLTPRGVSPSVMFVLSIWVALLLTLGGAEWWIRLTRARPAPLPHGSPVSF